MRRDNQNMDIVEEEEEEEEEHLSISSRRKDGIVNRS